MALSSRLALKRLNARQRHTNPSKSNSLVMTNHSARYAVLPEDGTPVLRRRNKDLTQWKNITLASACEDAAPVLSKREKELHTSADKSLTCKCL